MGGSRQLIENGCAERSAGVPSMFRYDSVEVESPRACAHPSILRAYLHQGSRCSAMHSILITHSCIDGVSYAFAIPRPVGGDWRRSGQVSVGERPAGDGGTAYHDYQALSRGMSN